MVAIKHAKVSDYASKSLNAYEDAQVIFDCEFERAKDIREWYDSFEMEPEFKSLSTNIEQLLGPYSEEIKHNLKKR